MRVWGLEGDAVLENGYLGITARLAGGEASAFSHIQHSLSETLQEGIHAFAFDEGACIKVYPMPLVPRQGAVGGHLERGHKRGEGGATSGGEKDQLTPGGGKGRAGHEVVARRREQVQAGIIADTLAVRQDATYGSGAGFLRASERFLLERGDAAGLIAGRGVLAFVLRFG